RQLLRSGGQGGGRTLGLKAFGPPAVLVLVVPQVREMRQHFSRKQIDVLLAKRSRHGAEVQEREQVPHAQALDAVDELLAHGLPTTTKPRPNKSLALSSRRLILARGL